MTIPGGTPITGEHAMAVGGETGDIGYGLMPNPFHLVLRPRGDGDLGRWMQWLLTAHARRDHRHDGTSGYLLT